MGFLSGVITGVIAAAGAAAWYMSRSGSKVREQYQFEQRLGELGDQMEVRTRDIQTQVTAQIAEMRGKANGHDADASDTLDAATASAAEAAAEVAADVESTAGKAKKAAKDVADEATS